MVVNRPNVSFTESTYNKWSFQLANHQFHYTPSQVRTKVKQLEDEWRAFKWLKNQTGVGWNEELKCIIATEEQWADMISRNKAMKQWKGKCCERYDDLRIPRQRQAEFDRRWQNPEPNPYSTMSPHVGPSNMVSSGSKRTRTESSGGKIDMLASDWRRKYAAECDAPPYKEVMDDIFANYKHMMTPRQINRAYKEMQRPMEHYLGA